MGRSGRLRGQGCETLSSDGLTLYGTANVGGACSDGTVFSLTLPNAATPTSTTVGYSPNPATRGAYATLTATISPEVPDTETVTFYNNGTSIGTGTTSAEVASLIITTLPVGSDNITAQYGGDTNFEGGTSNMVTETVN